MSQALYRKYRPKGWDGVLGQEHVVQTLRNAIAKDRVGHAYLFAGPRGTGKTTLARILAKAVNCLASDPSARPCNQCAHCQAVNEGRFLDLVEMDAASNTGVDNVRELRDKIGFSPSQGRFKVYIIDEVHMLTTQAFNALLKTLEEPPPHAMFVLATTEIDKIPATVLSRCQRHEFRRVPIGAIVSNLRTIVSSEGWQADEDALLLIARQATGSIRDAQSLLDQLASAHSRITLESAQPALGTATSQAVLDIIDAIRAKDSAAGLETLRHTLDSGVDPRTLARQLVEYLRGLMIVQMDSAEHVEATNEVRDVMKRHAAAIGSSKVTSMIKAFNSAAGDARGGWQPSLSLELALAECFAGGTERMQGGGTPPGDAAAPRRPSGSGLRNAGAAPAARDELATHAAHTDSSTMLYQESSPPVAVDPGGDAPAALAGKAAAGAEISSLNLADILTAWKEVRNGLKRTHPAIDGLLNSCKPVEIQGQTLVLGFQSDTVRAMMEKPENIDAACKAIEAVIGRSVHLRCVVISTRGKVPPNIPQDGMVATALNQGGKIVDMQE